MSQSMKALGCDTIKFLMSSDEGFAPGGAQVLMYSEEEAQAIGEAAREAGIWLACHAQAAEAVKRAVRAGFRAHLPLHLCRRGSARPAGGAQGRDLRGPGARPALRARAMRRRRSASAGSKPSGWARSPASN